MSALHFAGLLLLLSKGELLTAHDPCSHEGYEYIWMYEGRRSTHWATPDVTADVCDYYQSPRDVWYRFDHQAGTRLAEECVDLFRCGTQSPIWMNGSHPTDHKTVVRQVCAIYGVPNGRCCDWTANISVKKCNDDDGEFYVYKLANPQGCAVAYCVDGDSHKPCQPGYSWSPQTISCHPSGSLPTRTTTPTPRSTTTIPIEPTTTAPPGTWGPWSDWSDCSKSCDNGMRTRSRSCLNVPCQGNLTETELCARTACPESPDEWYKGISVLFSAVDDVDDMDHVMLKVVVKEKFLLKTWQDYINAECNRDVSACCKTSTGYNPVDPLKFVTAGDIWTAAGYPRRFQEDDVEFKFIVRINDDVDSFVCGRRKRRSTEHSTTYISSDVLEKAVNASTKRIQDATGLKIIGFRVPSTPHESTSTSSTHSDVPGTGQKLPAWAIALTCIACVAAAATILAFVIVVWRRCSPPPPPSYENVVKEQLSNAGDTRYLRNDGRAPEMQGDENLVYTIPSEKPESENPYESISCEDSSAMND